MFLSVTQIGHYVEKWVDTFFSSNTEGNDKSDITSLTPHYAKDPFNPIALDSNQILEQSKETYFQILNNHFEKNGIGGSIPFLQGRNLHDATRDALKKSMEECDVLLQMSFIIHQKDFCRHQIKSTLEAICGTFKKRNEERRCQFITKNAGNIKDGFVKSLEQAYFLLYFEKETEKLNDDSTLSRRTIPYQKFYEHQQMTKFVSDITNHTLAKCDAFINKMKVSPGESSSKPSLDDGLKMLEHTKMSIKRYGEDLLAKNVRNQGMTQDYIGILISTEFEEICKSKIKKMMCPGVHDIKTAVLKVKEDIGGDIRSILHKNCVGIEIFSMLESEYQGKMEIMEASVFKACLRMAASEAERSMKIFLGKVEDELNPDKAVVWIAELAGKSGVPERFVSIIKIHLMAALQQTKKDCLGTTVRSEGDSVDIKKDVGSSMDQKHNETNQLVKIYDDTRAYGPIDVELVSPPGSSVSVSRKHKLPSNNRSHNTKHSSEKKGRTYL